MENPPGPQFYSLEPQAPEAPWWKKKKLLVIAGSVVFAVIFMVVLAVLVMNVIGNSNAATERSLLLEQARNIANNKASDCKEGDTACKEGAKVEAAREVGEVDACKGVEGSRMASCVTMIAYDKEDAALCGALSGSAKSECEDGAYLLAARGSGDYTLCDKISDEVSRASCKASARSIAVAEGNCAKYDVPEEECTKQDALKAILALGDPAGCNSLPTDRRESCQDYFFSIDDDGDGLSLADEFKYGTSPTNADTDGDGYTDSVEIGSGNDPLK